MTVKELVADLNAIINRMSNANVVVSAKRRVHQWADDQHDDGMEIGCSYVDQESDRSFCAWAIHEKMYYAALTRAECMLAYGEQPTRLNAIQRGSV